MSTERLFRDTTIVGTPIVEQFGEEVLKTGFRPHLPDIGEAAKEIWKQEPEVPLTILTKMPTYIENWEPMGHLYRSKDEHSIVLALVQRFLWANGADETLFVAEGWQKHGLDDTPGRGQRILIVHWECRCANRSYVSEIRQGRKSEYLSATQESNNDTWFSNPAYRPWNTNDDLIEYFKIASKDRSEFVEMIEGIERKLCNFQQRSSTCASGGR